ncbi:MAG: hypothetical protein OEM29_00340 [Thermoplasmata archaeon]|nr:hypothetical protein [Thermoplasmata archaeon]
MRRKASGVILFAVFAMLVMSAQSVMAGAGSFQTLTACLKENPGEPLGTAVYSSWEKNGRSTLEITVAATGDYEGTYCIYIIDLDGEKTLLEPTLFVDDTGAGSLMLDTWLEDVIPPIASEWKISLKECGYGPPDVDRIVLCGKFM